jgi:hypothetical protein
MVWLPRESVGSLRLTLSVVSCTPENVSSVLDPGAVKQEINVMLFHTHMHEEPPAFERHYAFARTDGLGESTMTVFARFQMARVLIRINSIGLENPICGGGCDYCHIHDMCRWRRVY